MGNYTSGGGNSVKMVLASLLKTSEKRDGKYPKTLYTKVVDKVVDKTAYANSADPDQTAPEGAVCLFVCVEVLRPSQPDGVMSSAVSLPNHTFTGQA